MQYIIYVFLNCLYILFKRRLNFKIFKINDFNSNKCLLEQNYLLTTLRYLGIFLFIIQYLSP